MLIRHWLRVGVCLGLAMFACSAGRGDESSKSASAAPPAAEGAVPAKDEPLSASQEMISRRFKRFEETLSKIHESMRKTDPERAELLLRAIGKSKEDRIGVQMGELVQLLRDNKQLGDAIERQGDVVTQLHALLDLLLSEDRQKELKEEQARIKKYLEELNKIIAREKGNRADNERGASPADVADQQQKIADQTDKLGKAIDKDDKAKDAKGQKGESDPSKAGNAKDGKIDDGKDGKDGKGEPKKGDPKDGKPKGDPSKDGKPGEGEPKDGEPKDGAPKDGEPKDGKSADGESKPGKKGEEGKPGEGKPKPGEPQEGQPGDGKPSDGEPNGEKPPEQPTAGREELEKARRAMEQAIDKLKKNQRHEASDEQDEALANLQKAKEKLEEILRQLREEERERFLAMLEARFQRMLAMQLMVYDGTQKLGKTPEADRSSRHQTRALQLAREEDAIAVEASKAILLLREEGSAVAFPEAVEQVRDDMRIVEGRLERVDAGELTQSIEREIIDALEEMIEALQKEMEKSKEKKDNPPPKDSGQPQDPPLVDQLAELKMLRTLQLRVNHRTKRLGQMIEGEQASDTDVIGQLQNLADRQSRIQRATHDLATGKNK